MVNQLLTMWAEPRVDDPPQRLTRDWFVSGAMVVAVGLEGALRPELVLRPFTVIVGLLLSATLLWRRTHPLAMVSVMFGTMIALDTVARITEGAPTDLYSGIFVLINVYALFRWGSGREGALGLGVMAVAFTANVLQVESGIGDLIGGAIVLLAPVELGRLARVQAASRDQQIEQARLHEREQLARELHDTVAHHVSAIAIQAQAGQVLARSSSLAGAADALAVIEAEASRTLIEMRSMLGLLREPGRPAEMVPPRGIRDLHDLARPPTPLAVPIELDVCETLGELPIPVEAAVYRIVQESITNAQRHALDASRISVSVRGEGSSIVVVVDDDGTPRSRPLAEQGYGIVGMSERAAMLGGTLVAGPRLGKGWSVRADLPRQGVGR